ncbi:MAG TPA: DNA primase [Candidatus Binatia bacterium]|nr:DNA primase [Candidatus Binatia bacterium]
MISPEKISEIRHRASIVEVISDYVTLKKAGRNHMGLCPFHGEKTPSFTVSEEKGIYHCFGCQAGGSVFNFLMQYDHLAFPEAVERVAKRYGIVIERSEQSAAARAAGDREYLYRINEQAAAHYQKILFRHPEGRRALEYLASRGVDEAVARKFMLGYAPQGGSGLLQLLRQENVAIEHALRLGLVGERAPRQYREKFFARLMFPIANAAGKIVAFGGRVLDNALPKYLNSSETPLFHKRSTLYGLHQAKESIRKADRVVVVEGYLDVIALAQHELSYAVATLGTALTVDHIRLLSRYTKNVIALFDGDDAGQKAAARSFEVFVEAGLLGRAAFLPKQDDPDTFVRQHGKTRLELILDEAVPLADFFFLWLERRYGKSLEGKSQIAAEVSRVLAKLNNPLEVDLLVGRAVDLLGIREETMRQRTHSPLPARTAQNRPVAPAAMPREDKAEQMLIGAMLRLPKVIEQVAADEEARQGFSSLWTPAVDVILNEWQNHENIEVARLSEILPAQLASEIARLALETEDLTDAVCSKVAMDCLARLKGKHIKAQKRDERLKIRVAEEQKDENAKRERILEWQDLVRKERQLEHRKLEPKARVR